MSKIELKKFSLDILQEELNADHFLPFPTYCLFQDKNENGNENSLSVIGLRRSIKKRDKLLSSIIEFAIMRDEYKNADFIFKLQANYGTGNIICKDYTYADDIRILFLGAFDLYWRRKCYCFSEYSSLRNNAINREDVTLGDYFLLKVHKILVLFGETKERLEKSGKKFEDEVERRTAGLHPAYYEHIPFLIYFLVDEPLIKFYIYHRGL